MARSLAKAAGPCDESGRGVGQLRTAILRYQLRFRTCSIPTLVALRESGTLRVSTEQEWWCFRVARAPLPLSLSVSLGVPVLGEGGCLQTLYPRVLLGLQ